ncbi:MAG: FixH family protein [Reyranella sp.]|uniref:FixH family protein n=1 Tax=Reyranella sp. TaxID=1929291 RepID=UPI003D146F9E
MTTDSTARDRHVPWLFVGGFAVVVGVNAIMVWLAIGSFSGLYTPQPRQRSLHYNEIIARQADRDALGWRLETSWHAPENRLEIAVVDARGRPLGNARLHAELVRPVEKRAPVAVDLVAVDGGRYAATVTLPARGNWDLDVVIDYDGRRFAQTRRMFLE